MKNNLAIICVGTRLSVFGHLVDVMGNLPTFTVLISMQGYPIEDRSTT